MEPRRFDYGRNDISVFPHNYLDGTNSIKQIPLGGNENEILD